MTAKGCFQNQFADFAPESEKVDALITALENKEFKLSDIFLEKLEKFQNAKLHHLKTNMRNDIFHDGTVYTGSSGLALYYFLKYTINTENMEYLRSALAYLNLNNLRGHRISFLCGDAGPLALGAVISYKLSLRRPDDLPDYKILVQRLLSLISVMEQSPDELLYGKAGYLYALLFVNKHISGKEVIPASHIEKVVLSILQSGKQYSTHMKCDSPLLWQWHDKIYFGAAHGMAGIIYILLQARPYIILSDLRNFIKPAVDWLLNHCLASGNFPSSLGSASGDRLVQWCHGAPGFLPLCIAAYQISGGKTYRIAQRSRDSLIGYYSPYSEQEIILKEFEEEKYMKLALRCGEMVWERGLSAKGYSICHGVSGNAYTFLQLYQITKKPIHLYRACCFMEWCAVERPGTELHRPDRPASLFEGLAGRLYLLEDMKQPLNAKFPAFTI